MSKKIVAALVISGVALVGSGVAIASKNDPFGVRGMSPNTNSDAADIAEPDYSGVTSAPYEHAEQGEQGGALHHPAASPDEVPPPPAPAAPVAASVVQKVQAAPVVPARQASAAPVRPVQAVAATPAAPSVPAPEPAPALPPVEPVVVPPPVVAPPPVQTPEGKRVSLSRDERAFIDQEAQLMQRIRVLRLQRDEYMLRDEIRKIVEGDRKPADPVLAPVISMPVLDVVDVAPEPPARLVSTWGTEGALKADLLFEGRRRSYSPGDKVGAWTVQSVRSGEVVIVKGREKMTLRRGG